MRVRRWHGTGAIQADQVQLEVLKTELPSVSTLPTAASLGLLVSFQRGS
jgi:hypothetical protein